MSTPEAPTAQTAIPEEYLLKEEPEQNQPTAGATARQPEVQEETIPEKFRGKTPAELIEMYRHAESELGRSRNEVGQMRRLADELLGINRAVAAGAPKSENLPQRKPLTTDDLLQNPEQAVVEVVRAEAQAREAGVSDRVAALEAQLQLARLEQKHPGYQTTIQDPKFAEWIQKTPLRTSMAQAAMNGNYAAADELLVLYKEAQPSQTPAETSPTDRARAAGLVRSGGAASTAASNPSASRQIWSREKLLEMRIKQPEEFERLQPEILQAYREKRVR